MAAYDFIIIGAGIAGAGLAYELAPYGSVLLLEAEHIPGYHTTGRSAAFYAETYGGPYVQPLTTASKAFFTDPPTGFSDVPLIASRGAYYYYTHNQQVEADAMLSAGEGLLQVENVDAARLEAIFPYLNFSHLAGAVYDSRCRDLDVAALHQGYLRQAKRAGAEIMLNTPVQSMDRHKSFWEVRAPNGNYHGTTVINCAGAWADKIALIAGGQALGLQPMRRTIVTVTLTSTMDVDPSWPLLLDISGQLYFKPEGSGFLISPADETLSEPADAQPELEDVAIAIDRFQDVTGLSVDHVVSKWAGLRTFAQDRMPVIGWDHTLPDFFWSVGQGGWGIQTSPAWCALAASMLLKQSVPDWIESHGVKAGAYTPARLR